MYGYTFSKDTREITGEQNVLRYSAYDCWLKSKSAYRGRYYRGKSFETPETVFGHKMHKKIEEGEIVLPGLPVYPAHEVDILANLGDVKIGGCIDTLDPDTLQFLDYKFGHRNKDGKAPWDNVKVHKHRQLIFYTLLVKLKHGHYNPETALIWVETAFKNRAMEFDGHMLEADTRELELTGKFEIFERRIAKWELDKLVMDIKRVAEEIRADFEEFKKSQHA